MRPRHAPRRQPPPVINWSDWFASLYDDVGCIGHLLETARGFTAVDANDVVLGTFPNRAEAERVVMEAAATRR